MILRKNSAAAFIIIAICTIANAQVTQDQLDAISKASSSQIDSAMKAVAEAAASNMPMQIDAVTTLTGAMYLKQVKTIIYYGKIKINLTEQQRYDLVYQAQETFCKSAMNKAWTAKGVTYRYISEMPNGKNDYAFDKNSCR